MHYNKKKFYVTTLEPNSNCYSYFKELIDECFEIFKFSDSQL